MKHPDKLDSSKLPDNFKKQIIDYINQLNENIQLLEIQIKKLK